MSFTDRLFRIGVAAWDKLPQLLLTLIVGYIVIKIIKAIIHGLIRVSKTNSAMKGILMSVIDIALWMFLFAALLQQIGLPQVALALSSTVAIAGLAIATGSSVFIQDLVSGLFLAQDPDFNVGDRIKVLELEGTVERMDARKIRMRDDKGLLHVLPNSTFDKSSWSVIQRKGGKN
jgi:small-conductance mechanosensitive channel